MTTRVKILLAVQLFNAVSAIIGGAALMYGVIDERTWIEHTAFTDLYFPGVILMAIVGGSALIAAIAILKRVESWRLMSLVAGWVMMFWIVGEVISIRDVHFLQGIYLITGLVAVWLTPDADDDGMATKKRIHP